MCSEQYSEVVPKQITYQIITSLKKILTKNCMYNIPCIYGLDYKSKSRHLLKIKTQEHLKIVIYRGALRSKIVVCRGKIEYVNLFGMK